MTTITSVLPPRPKLPAAPAVAGVAGLPKVDALSRARITNLSSRRRREWVSFALPYGRARFDKRCTAFLTDRGLFLRAVRGEDVGRHSTIWRVFAPLDGSQTISGTVLEPGPVDEDWKFGPHPWCSDTLAAVIPRAVIRVRGVDYRVEQWPILTLDSESPAHQTFYASGPVPGSGFVAHVWLTFEHQSPVGKLEAAFIWADPTNPEPILDVDGIAFVTGEFVAFDFSARNGLVAQPVRAGDSWFHEVAGKSRLRDGSGFAVQGRMLCLPQVPVGELGEEWVDDIETLFAAYTAPALGLAEPGAWADAWLAHRNVPRYSNPSQAAATLDAWLLDDTLGLTYFHSMPIGCAKTPGQTGEQEDFGATKGWIAVSTGDARWLHYAKHASLAEYFRGYMYHESDGTPLDLAKHPQWGSYVMETHYSTNLSPDRLGKRNPGWGEVESAVSGYKPYDDQHRSLNNAFAVYALTGSPLLRFALERAAVAWGANVFFKLQLGVDVSRAVGRRGHTYASLMLLFAPGTPTYETAFTLQSDMKRQFLNQWLGGKFEGGVDVLDVASDPRLQITWQGNVVPAWSGWGQGLLFNGIYALAKVTKDAEWAIICKRVAKTSVRHVFYKDEAGRWQAASVLAWVDEPLAAALGGNLKPGDPLPAAAYAAGSTLILLADAGIREWAGTCLHGFVELADKADPDCIRALEIIAEVAGDPGDAMQAQWRAVARATPPEAGDFSKYLVPS